MQPVRKAVIPAAGLGTRFLPVTKSIPKEMLPLVDKPSIQYVVEEAVTAGLTDVLVITGRGKRAIEDHFDRNVELEQVLERRERPTLLDGGRRAPTELADVHYIRQREALGLGHAVSVAEPARGGEPFVVHARRRHHGRRRRAAEADARRSTSETGGSVLALMEVPPEEIARTGALDRVSRCATASCGPAASSRSRSPRTRRRTWR